MSIRLRSLWWWIAAGGFLAAITAAVRSSSLPPADFTFVNGTEVKSLDPAIVTGQPENRLINALFEGLVRWDPETLEPLPGRGPSVGDRGRPPRYTFFMRPEARWSDGSRVTADDFRYSFRRFLDPRTAARVRLSRLVCQERPPLQLGRRGVRPGDRVEVELNRSPDDVNTLRGELVRGTLLEIRDAKGEPLSAAEIEAAAADPQFSVESWTYAIRTDEGPRAFRYTDDEVAARGAAGRFRLVPTGAARLRRGGRQVAGAPT